MIRFGCPTCSEANEVADNLGGQAVTCWKCGQPVMAPLPSAQPLTRGDIERYTVKAGSGCLVQGIGLILLFIFPIGTIIGVGLLIAGSAMSQKFRCSRCGSNLTSKRVQVCPCCHVQFK